jgi:hypothetical protein
MNHKASSRGAPQKHRNTKIEPEPEKIGRSTGTVVGGISTFCNVFTIVIMMKGE